MTRQFNAEPIFLRFRWANTTPSHDWELWKLNDHTEGWRVVASGTREAVEAAERLLGGEATP